jgi:hypothetical protein
LVQPFLAYTDQEVNFTLDPKEVKNILEIPISFIINDLIVKEKNIKTSYSELMIVPVFEIQEFTVWGATAMMLNELKEILKSLKSL